MELLPNTTYTTKNGYKITTTDRVHTKNKDLIYSPAGWYYRRGKYVGMWESAEDDPNYEMHIILLPAIDLFLED